MIDLTAFVGALFALLASLVTLYLVPWLKEKLGAEKLAGAAYWVGVLVSAAEQMFKGSGRGDEKLKWVQGELARRGFTLDTDQIRALIEAQVRELSAGEIVAQPMTINVDTTTAQVTDWQKEVPPEVPGSPKV